MSEVTVLMTVFNGMPYLTEAVESILSQTLSDFEFVIVDDGSTDGTPEYLRSLQDPRVRIIRQENGGTAAAANHGLTQVTTRFVARMDADDIALPTRLEKQLAFMNQNPDVGVLGTQVVPVGDAGHGKSLALPCVHEELFADMMKCKHGLAHSSVMIDADRLKSIGGYWSLKLIDDWDMMLRMGEISRLANLDEVLVMYRVHSGSLNGTNMLRMQRSIAYATELARRRQSGSEPISYESFVEELDNAPFFQRTHEWAQVFALTQYRIAVADLCGGKKILGTSRLCFAALFSPRRTIDRIGRIMRFSNRPQSDLSSNVAQSVKAPEIEPPKHDGEVLDVHVVILNNYVRVHHAVSYVELSKRVRKLTVLLSVPMEPNKDWSAQWMGLDVRVQKNWMFTKKWKHSRGFTEDNYIHLPVDTVKQLKQLKPDIVFSYEMGVRTLLSGWFRRWNQSVPLVMVGNMSQDIERERSYSRRFLRGIIRRVVDYCTYNGPSCKRYLESLGMPEEKMHHVPYCIDPEVVDSERREVAPADKPRTLLYSGGIIPRKGIVEFTDALKTWCRANPGREVVFQLAGAGSDADKVVKMQSGNLKIELLGDLDHATLRQATRAADICVNPTFADEWGLVPIEALASGIPVLGSLYAQSVETVVKDGHNGWVFRTDDTDSVVKAIDAAMAYSNEQLVEMQDVCRQSVAHITPVATAECFANVIRHALSADGKVKTKLVTEP